MLILGTYVGAITLANLLVYEFGPWWSPINALLLIGLDLTLRDRLHDKYGLFASVVAIMAGGLISYLLNPAASMIAIASVMAFVLANLADAATYQLLIRKRFVVKANCSNVVGAAVDSILFPTLAFGAWNTGVITLQFAAKVAGGFVVANLISRRSHD